MLGFICSVLLTVGAIPPAEAYHLNRSHSYMGHYLTRTFLGHTVFGKSLKTIALVTAKGLCVWRGTWHVHVWGCTFVCWHTYTYAHVCVDAIEPLRVLFLWHLPFSWSWNSPCRWVRLADLLAPGIHPFPSTSIGITDLPIYIAFLCRFWIFNLGPWTCPTNSSLTELSPQPTNKIL